MGITRSTGNRYDLPASSRVGSCWGWQEDWCCVFPSGAPWFLLLGAFLSPRGPGFDRGCAGHSDTGTGFLPVLLLSPVSTIPPMLHTHLHLQGC